MSQEGLIDKIDKALKEYYKQRGNHNYYNSNGDGIFKVFCNDNGFENDDVKEELQANNGDDCTLTDFDDDFPFDKAFANIEDKCNEILRILKHIAEYGSYSSQQSQGKPGFDMSICANVTQKDIDEAVIQYSQMQCLSKHLEKDNNLKYFFALSNKCDYPFLTYMVDSYTRDRAIHFQKHEKQLRIIDWAKDNSFMKKLKEKYPHIERNLQSAMQLYSYRIMKRLQFTPTYKINDDLKEICEYISEVPAFINQLMNELKGGAPFQVDLYIAVKNIEKQVRVGDENDDEKENDNSDDDDDDDDKTLNPDDDHIGDVVDNCKNFPVAHFYRKNKETPIKRDLGQRFTEFRTELSEFNKKHDNDDDKENKDKIEFNAATYPRNKRFGIFVDRRENKQNDDEEKKEDQDLITFFQHPENCNTIKNNRVPEIGFELLLKCLIPRGTKEKPKNITANTDVCGQLLTFMFNIEQKGEIRCYIVWNAQTMRFEGDNIMNVLPYLFVENQDNIEFITEKQPLEKLKKAFVKQMKDEKYTQFCKASGISTVAKELKKNSTKSTT